MVRNLVINFEWHFYQEHCKSHRFPRWESYWLSLSQSAQASVHWSIFERPFISATIYYLKMSSLFCCCWKINDSVWAPNMYTESSLTNFLKLCISVLSAADKKKLKKNRVFYCISIFTFLHLTVALKRIHP